MSRLMKDLLPSDVSVIETDTHFGALLPAELEYFRPASTKRVREATTARACARQLLVAYGFEDYALVPALDGSPSWPASVVGSITHSHGHTAVAVGQRSRYRGIGIDSELATPIPDATFEMIRHSGDASQVKHPLWTTIHFSAKEAVFKALSAVGFTGLHLSDIGVQLKSSGRFVVATDPTDGWHDLEIAGRWGNRHEHVATAVVIAGRS